MHQMPTRTQPRISAKSKFNVVRSINHTQRWIGANTARRVFQFISSHSLTSSILFTCEIFLQHSHFCNLPDAVAALPTFISCVRLRSSIRAACVSIATA